LFTEGGARAITHRAVAARAGLPPATTTYYFESIDALIREALGSHVDQWTQYLEKLTEFDLQPNMDINDATALVAAVFAQRGPDVAAVEISIYLAAARDPQLHDVARAAIRALDALATTALTKGGIPDAQDLAASIVSLIGGTGLHRQSGLFSEPQEARMLVTSIRKLVAGHMLGHEGINQTLAEMFTPARLA
jgi:DNA-binding transcriptional regulator YbjK